MSSDYFFKKSWVSQEIAFSLLGQNQIIGETHEKKLHQPKNYRRNPRRVARSSYNQFLIEKTAFRVFNFCRKIAYTTLTLFRLFDDFLIISCFFTDF